MTTLLVATCAVALACLIGCGTNATTVAMPSPQDTLAIVAGDTLAIGLGSSSTTRDGRLRVTFVRLVSDSRCRQDVTCVWAGDAAVRLRGEASSGSVEATIHTTLQPRSFTVSAYELSLLNVLPYPGARDSTGTPTVVVLARLK